ncbi:MAG: hypothetical protein Q4D96_12670 [Propionibacteriaceae bacterium]|nr:hypothetical protein [Propionibacteriaceae bacterium]
MTTTAKHRHRVLGSTTILWLLATGISAIRIGTLLGLFPRLVQATGMSGPVAMLLLHIAGAFATLVALLAHSRLGLLLAVLYTGYSTVVLALGAPTPSLQALTWSVGGLTFVSVLACAASTKTPPLSRGLPAIALAAGAMLLGVVLLLVLR